MANEIVSKQLNDKIDKILSSDLVEMPEDQPEDQDQGLLKLAAMLAKVDFTPTNKKSYAEFIAQIQDKQELNDDELDLVAGGVDLKGLLAQHKRKK